LEFGGEVAAADGFAVGKDLEEAHPTVAAVHVFLVIDDDTVDVVAVGGFVFTVAGVAGVAADDGGDVGVLGCEFRPDARAHVHIGWIGGVGCAGLGFLTEGGGGADDGILFGLNVGVRDEDDGVATMSGGDLTCPAQDIVTRAELERDDEPLAATGFELMKVVVGFFGLLVIHAAECRHGFEQRDGKVRGERRAVRDDLQAAAVVVISWCECVGNEAVESLEGSACDLPLHIGGGLGYVAHLHHETDVVLLDVVSNPLRVAVEDVGVFLRVELCVRNNGNGEGTGLSRRETRRGSARCRLSSDRRGFFLCGCLRNKSVRQKQNEDCGDAG